jgi:predicted unusual protein kinase regulating ubiquinone biosynthesis (AarF/ABC1/UbiB family)
VNHVKVIPEFFQTAMSIKVAEGIALALDPSIEMARIAIPIIVKSQAAYVMNKALGKRTIDDEDDDEDDRLLQKLMRPVAFLSS